MENERKLKLLETMKAFNKNSKDEILSFGNESEDSQVIATGIKSVDSFLGGGTKQSTFTIFWGGYGSGKTSLVLQQIGNAQKKGLICCYINLEKPIDKSRFETFGVNLSELVLVNYCKNAEQALEIIRTMCKEKVVDLIVIDSIQAMCPKNTKENKNNDRALEEKEIAELARTMSKFFQVVNSEVFRAKASVVFIGQTRTKGIGTFFTSAGLTGGEAIKFYSYQIIFMRKGENSNAPTRAIKEYYLDPDGKMRYTTIQEAVGFEAVLRMDKTNSSDSVREKAEIKIPFLYDNGFVDIIPSFEEDIRITGTDEEKEMITKTLIEKGVLKSQNLPVSYEVQQDDKIVDEGIILKEESKKKKGRPKKIDK